MALVETSLGGEAWEAWDVVRGRKRKADLLLEAGAERPAPARFPARNERVGQRKRELGKAMAGTLPVKDRAAVLSDALAQDCSRRAIRALLDTFAVGVLQSSTRHTEWNVPALSRSTGVYDHPFFAALAERFNRRIIGDDDRGMISPCTVQIKFKEYLERVRGFDKLPCIVCACSVWGLHVEYNCRSAHVSCAVWAANSLPR